MYRRRSGAERIDTADRFFLKCRNHSIICPATTRFDELAEDPFNTSQVRVF
jgi:hypothetical protein